VGCVQVVNIIMLNEDAKSGKYMIVYHKNVKHTLKCMALHS